MVQVGILILKGYRYLVSPWLGQRCRFYPSCSQYGIESLEKYGFVKGCTKTMIRLGKCHPYHQGGVDLP